MTNNEFAARNMQGVGDLISVTIDPNTARIIKLEGIDAAGARHDLSDEEKATLLRHTAEGTLEQVVERAFEAGIACVLDGEKGRDESNDSLEDVELTHQLLVPLIEHSHAKKLIARDTLDRAMVDTLIAHSMTSATATGARPEAGSR